MSILYMRDKTKSKKPSKINLNNKTKKLYGGDIQKDIKYWI